MTTASDIAELQGLLALIVARRTDRAAGRDPETVADQVLAEIAAPDVQPALTRLRALVGPAPTIR